MEVLGFLGVGQAENRQVRLFSRRVVGEGTLCITRRRKHVEGCLMKERCEKSISPDSGGQRNTCRLLPQLPTDILKDKYINKSLCNIICQLIN